MITKNGRVVNKAFNSKMFLVLMNMVDPERVKEGGQLTQNQDQIMEFLKTLFDCNPDCFTTSQTLILLTRISLVGFTAMHNRTELSYEVLEIFQYLLKYNKSSSTHNLKNLALLALTIMVTKDGLTVIAWNMIRNLISMDPDRIVYEILEILMIGNYQSSLASKGQSAYQKGAGAAQPPPMFQSVDNDIRESEKLEENIKKIVKNQKAGEDGNEMTIMKELYIKCFNQKRDEFKLDLEEIENDLASKHKSCLINIFEEIDANLSMDELICKMECPSFFINQHQSSSIIDFDSR